QRGSVVAGTARAELFSGDNVWVARDLMVILGLDIGDRLRIGSKDFTVQDVILEDPTSTISAMVTFPPIYMGLPQLESTGLIQLGSRITYSRFYKLPPGYDVGGLEEVFAVREREVFRDTRRLSMTTHEEESEDLARILGL